MSAMQAGIDGFKYIFIKPALRVFSFNYALISSLTFFMFWFYQSLLLDNKFPLSLQGFIASGFNMGAIILLLFTGKIQAKIGIRNMLFYSSIIPGILYIGIFCISGTVMAIAAIFGVTMLRIFRAPMLAALMNTHITSDNRATVLSGVSIIERVLITILYPLAGILTDTSLRWTFLFMGIITLLVAVLTRVEEKHL